MTIHEYEFCMKKLLEKFKGKKFGEFLENVGSIASEYIFVGIVYDFEGTLRIECRNMSTYFRISTFDGGELHIDKTLKFASVKDFLYHYNISIKEDSNINFEVLIDELFRKFKEEQFDTFIPWRNDLTNKYFNYYTMNDEHSLVCTCDAELFRFVDGVIKCGDISFNSETVFRDFFQTSKNY